MTLTLYTINDILQTLLLGRTFRTRLLCCMVNLF